MNYPSAEYKKNTFWLNKGFYLLEGEYIYTALSSTIFNMGLNQSKITERKYFFYLMDGSAINRKKNVFPDCCWTVYCDQIKEKIQWTV